MQEQPNEFNSLFYFTEAAPYKRHIFINTHKGHTYTSIFADVKWSLQCSCSHWIIKSACVQCSCMCREMKTQSHRLHRVQKWEDHNRTNCFHSNRRHSQSYSSIHICIRRKRPASSNGGQQRTLLAGRQTVKSMTIYWT